LSKHSKPLKTSQTVTSDKCSSLKPLPESTKYDARIRNVGGLKQCVCGGVYWLIDDYEICGDCRIKR